MTVQVALLAVCVGLGVAAQLVADTTRFRSVFWLVYFWTITPVLVFVTFLTLAVDRRLALGVGAAILASWTVGLVSYAYAHAVARGADERGALALGAAFGNTGFVGFPLAQLAFGHAGLSLAVVYDQLAWLVPNTSVSTVVARLHGRRRVDVGGDSRLRAILLNPPLLALVTALVLRAAGADVPFVGAARSAAAAVVGPAGFLLLGLSLPLEPLSHEARELTRAAGALAIRFGAGPLALWIAGRAVGAHVPAAFYLLAGMPCAFHLLVLARVYDLRPALMRLLVVASTASAVTVVVVAVALRR